MELKTYVKITSFEERQVGLLEYESSFETSGEAWDKGAATAFSWDSVQILLCQQGGTA